MQLIIYKVNNIECGPDKFYDLLFKLSKDFLLFKDALKQLDKKGIVKIYISNSYIWYQFERLYIDENEIF